MDVSTISSPHEDSKQHRVMPGMPHRENKLYDKQTRGGCREHTHLTPLYFPLHTLLFMARSCFSPPTKLKCSWNLLHAAIFFYTCTSLLFSHHVKASEDWSTQRPSREREKNTCSVYYSILLMPFLTCEEKKRKENTERKGVKKSQHQLILTYHVYPFNDGRQ